MRSGDPLHDFYEHEKEVEDRESRCPICDCCGEPITDETFCKVNMRGKVLCFHWDCTVLRYTEDYITEGE